MGQDEQSATTPLLEQEEHHDVEEPALPSVLGKDSLAHHGTAWQLTAVIMVGEMLGVGALTMPADFARLGWWGALTVLTAMGLAVSFSGVMYARLGERVPRAKAFDDIARAAYGRWGTILSYCTVYVAIFAVPALLHLTSAESLLQIFAPQGLTRVQANIVIALIIIPLSQVRGLEHVSWLSLVGTLGMMTAMAVACVKLLAMSSATGNGQLAQQHHHGSGSAPELQHGFKAVLVALMDLVFAYGGQQNWVRYLAGMGRKKDFKFSAAAASAVMTICFAIVGAVGYMRLGTKFDQSQPITSVLPRDAWTPVMNGGLLAHCILAYQIDLNVWAHTLLLLAAPQWADPVPSSAPAAEHRKSALLWLVTSLLGAAVATAIAWSVPFFSTICGLIAAVGDMAAAFILPALFCLRLVRPAMRTWEVGLCWALVPVAVVLAILGTWSSGLQLVLQIRQQHVHQP